MKYWITLACLTIFCATAAAQIGGQGGIVTSPCTSGGATPSISFVGRSQASCNAASCTATVSVPAGIVSGDIMIVAVEWNNGSAPSVPSGLTFVTSAEDTTNTDFLGIYRGTYNSTNSFGFTDNFVKVIMRAYHNSSAFDASAASATTSTATSFNAPALSATARANEWWVGFWVDTTGTITGPSLSHSTTDGTQYPSFDGDTTIASQFTTQGTETATVGTATGWTSAAIQIVPG